MHKKTLLISIISLLAVAVIGVFVYFFLDGKRQEAQTALVQKQQQEEQAKLAAERAEKAKKDKEIEEVKKGWDSFVGGKIESINNEQRSIVIDTDPLGKHKIYTVHVDENTKYEMVYVDAYPEEAGSDELDSTEENVKQQEFEIDFGRLEAGASATVDLGRRMDVDNAEKLVAQKITVIYYKTIK